MIRKAKKSITLDSRFVDLEDTGLNNSLGSKSVLNSFK